MNVHHNDMQPVEIIDGRYALQDELGRGGHGIVYRAYDQKLGMPVALKLLRQNIAEDPQYAVRLWREAEALRALWGESVVQVYGFGHDQDGTVYMVMELLEGETLAEHLENLEDFGDRMSAFEVLRSLDPVARALHTAHSLGIIHRDIKPANIFLVSPEMGGGVRLMDFGLVKIAGADQLTQAGMVAGSPTYIAPEVWRTEAIDPRADIYSLAVVVFRCLAGRAPFAAPNPLELFMKVIKEARPRLTSFRPDLPSAIDTWVARALAIDRNARYYHVSEMWNDLLRIIMSGNTKSAERARSTFRLPG